jgi:hypothetical protein
MDRETVLKMLRESTLEPYQLGLAFRRPMIPLVRERSVDLPAGPLRFVVEGRHLTDDAVAGALREEKASDAAEMFDDYGPTLHVFGAADGMEHLRFDCFAHKPHYHYVQEGGAVNVVCRIDQIAEGDVVEWAIDRVRRRLPEMLEHCGASDLAEQVREGESQILPVIDEVAALLRQAREQAVTERMVSHQEVVS